MLIGISGKIGSGKDTLGTILQEWNPQLEVKKFAYKLKQITSIITGIEIADLERQEVKDSFLSPEWNKDGAQITYRQVLQWIGTEAMRNNLHTNIWVNALFADYHDYSNWVITDVRFPNEADSIKERNGILLRIERPGLKLMDHPSETSLDDYKGFDYVIHNKGTIGNLSDFIQWAILPILEDHAV